MKNKKKHMSITMATRPFLKRVILLTVPAVLAVAGCSKKPVVDAGPTSREVSEQPLLDADGNGLYDDTERKALTDVFLEECPELQDILNRSSAPVIKAATDHQEDFEEGSSRSPKGAEPPASTENQVFDADGDGKVTVDEQSRDWHPLSVLMPRRLVESARKIPWAIDIFPEWISSAYLQDDVAPGKVASHMPRGTIPAGAEQADLVRQPQKTGERSGIEFAANSGQFLTLPGRREARWDYRWCLFTFRIDASSGSDQQTVLLDLNAGEGSNHSSPKIWFNKATGLGVQYVGLNKGGLDRRVMTGDNVVADGRTWNVLVCGIRYGQMFASLNGVPLATRDPQPDRFSGEWPKETKSYVGDRSAGNMAWAFDSLIFGLTEPSEAMVRKMTGWAAHRLGFAGQLPEGHPYRDQRPVLDAEDFPTRYVHDDEKWNALGLSVKDKSVTRVNAGGPRIEPKGFERVFYEDFRADRVKASSSGESDVWGGPGFNVSVGVDAPLITPGRQPNAYPYDAEKQHQMVSLVPDGKRWRGSAIYTVNDLGHGYTWKGPKVIRIRCMFPKVDQKDLTKGLFPAFWSYDPSNLLWRTANRIEVDWFEFDGQNGKWLNGLSTHYHYPYRKTNNPFAKNTNSYKRFKAYGGELTEEKSKIPGGLFVWDGQFHTWEWVVEEDMTYANVTIPDENGQDRWVEVYRCPTAPTYLEALDLQFNYALKGKYGVPKAGERQDFVVDWIEVLQKSQALDALPAPFRERPRLSGTVAAGQTVTCEPNLEGITDVRYYWFADGYPLTWGPKDTYTLTKAEAGKEIRCMVKAVGARDMPEAWSNVLK